MKCLTLTNSASISYTMLSLPPGFKGRWYHWKKKNDAGHRLCMRQLFHALFFSKQRLKMVIQVFMGIEKLNHGKKKYGRVNNVTCIASRTQCLYCPTLFKHTIERRKVRLQFSWLLGSCDQANSSVPDQKLQGIFSFRFIVNKILLQKKHFISLGLFGLV